MKKGIDLQYLVEESYWKKSRSMARLSGFCISQAHFSEDSSIAWSTVYQRDFRRFKAKLSDVDSVADDLRAVEGVKIAAVFRETEKKSYRVSLRSSYGINVAQVAKHFGGGGHHNAAGCSVSAAEKEKLLQHLSGLLS